MSGRARRVLPAFDPAIADLLETVYGDCTGPGRLALDPLALVVRYDNVRDREIAGLVASTLAFGSVRLILRACESALAPLGDRPARTLLSMDDTDIDRAWSAFRYRYVFPRDMIALLTGARNAAAEAGSLEAFFLRGDPGGNDIAEAAGVFVRGLRSRGAAGLRKNLLPDPADGSACKRLFLYLRWMVRKDAIDPGGWTGVDPARLLVPLDVHLFRTCRDRLGFFGPGANGRRTANPDLRDARQVTAAFRLYSPGDPARYDFALTRPGIDPRPGDERYGCL